MNARLYIIPASHPSIAIELMLKHKGIDYKRTDLLPVVSKGVLRAVGFPGVTVPPLLPTDPEQRAAVEEAERFGDEELQHPVRQILWWGMKKDHSPLRSYSEGARIGMPIGLAMKTA